MTTNKQILTTIKTNGDGEWEFGTENIDIYSIEINKMKRIEPDYNYEETIIIVHHNAFWEVYTDSGFQDGISDYLGYEVNWTEQGMQKNNYAHMIHGEW